MSQVEGVGFLRENDLCRSWGVGNCVGHRECGEVIERLLGKHRYGGAEEDLLGYILSGKNHVCSDYKPDKSCSQDISGLGQDYRYLKMWHHISSLSSQPGIKIA